MGSLKKLNTHLLIDSMIPQQAVRNLFHPDTSTTLLYCIDFFILMSIISILSHTISFNQNFMVFILINSDFIFITTSVNGMVLFYIHFQLIALLYLLYELCRKIPICYFFLKKDAFFHIELSLAFQQLIHIEWENFQK